MRRKDQTVRREQLARAGRQVLLERGAVGIRVKDIADRAGIAPSSVLYYYPRIEELLLEVSRDAIHRYAERRSRQVRLLDDPTNQLRLAIHLGVPTGPDDEDSRLLYELDALTGSRTALGCRSYSSTRASTAPRRSASCSATPAWRPRSTWRRYRWSRLDARWS